MASLPPSLSASLASTGAGNTPLGIGQATFATSEVPDDLPIGGVEQMLAVHQLIGGGRVVQSFGPSATEVSWKGYLFDGNISLRVQQLRLYAVAGTEVLLTWGAEQYYCVVKRFVPTYKGGYAEYEIAVVVTRDANGAFTLSSPLSIDQQVAALQQQINDQNAAIGDADPNGSAAFQGNLANLSATIAQQGPIAQNIATAGPAISTASTSATSAVQSYQKTVSPTASWMPNVMMLVSSLQAITANMKRGQAPKTILTQGGSLFQVASKQYGDISQAFNLAAANGLPSPFLSGLTGTQLALPPLGSGN